MVKAGTQSRIAIAWKVAKTQMSEVSEEPDPPPSPSRVLLQSWLNKTIKVKISDGRRLIGSFLCTDQEMNIILGSCQEFVYSEDFENEEPRILGLAMIPGKHIVSLEIDEQPTPQEERNNSNEANDCSPQIQEIEALPSS